jgi:hypothetical protein
MKLLVPSEQLAQPGALTTHHSTSRFWADLPWEQFYCEFNSGTVECARMTSFLIVSGDAWARAAKAFEPPFHCYSYENILGIC